MGVKKNLCGLGLQLRLEFCHILGFHFGRGRGLGLFGHGFGHGLEYHLGVGWDMHLGVVGDG